jgi:flagellar motor protein MotB
VGASKKKGRKNSGQSSARGGWGIVYSGFVLILLSFFIMLSSFSTMEEAFCLAFLLC